MKDLSNFSGVSKRDGRWVIHFDGDAKAVNTRLYPLRGKGWDGTDITQDQVDDDGKRCAPEESVLPQLINLLDGIEFVNLQD
ncbi:hypothetical protein [Paraburkholderia ultramafica]|uniref:hypothetical protein n=1 Tax=Paraburkholderia ultramafica TaxID=1544867 RepID=UPI00158363A6|nr:hypothetical protein [Paraburkholderia ultramafica]